MLALHYLDILGYFTSTFFASIIILLILSTKVLRITSAVDGSSFIDNFAPNTNKVLFVDMEGESIGHLYFN